MATNHLKLTSENLSLMRMGVDNNIKSNPEFRYSVKLLGVFVVSQSRSIEQFDQVVNNLREEVPSLAIIYYMGSGNSGEPTHLYRSEDELFNAQQNTQGFKNPVVSLKGIPSEAEMRAQIRMEMDYDNLKAENNRLKRELADAKKVMDDVEEWAKKISKHSEETGDVKLKKMLGDFYAAVAVSRPDLLKQYPFIGMAAQMIGIVPAPASPPAVTTQQLGQIPVIPVTPVQVQADQSVLAEIEKIKSLRRYFSDVEFAQVLELVEWIKEHKEFLPYTYNWLLDQINAKLDYLSKTKQQPQQE